MRGGPGVIVTGVLMTVDSHCSVAISSLSEGECPPLITEPSPLPDTTTPDTGATPETTTGLVAGAVAAVVVIVLIIAVTIAIVIIVFLVLKSRRGELSLKKSDGKYVDIVHFIFTILSLDLPCMLSVFHSTLY